MQRHLTVVPDLDDRQAMIAAVVAERQTCCECLRPIGILPSGLARPYRTEHHDDGRRFHRCAERKWCMLARLGRSQ